MAYSLFISSKSAISARRTCSQYPKHQPNHSFIPFLQTEEGRKGIYTHRNLEDLLHARASLLDNSLDVLAAETGLLRDGTLNQNAVLGKGDLTGEEDLAVDFDGLGLLLFVSC